MTVHYPKVAIFGMIWACLGFTVACMRGGGPDETRTRGPVWGPAGNAPFRPFVHEVHAWLNIASGSMIPLQQALQRGLGV
eukprot:2913923-Pyramimonas_sp.AAC.2